MQWAIWGEGQDAAADMATFNQWKTDHPELVQSCGICEPAYEYTTYAPEDVFGQNPIYSGQLGCNASWTPAQCDALTAAGVKVRSYSWEGPIWPEIWE